VTRETTQGKTDSGIEITICSTLLLHSKEEQIITTSIRLQEIKLGHYQEQNTITINWRSHQQVKEGQVLQQIGLNLGV